MITPEDKEELIFKMIANDIEQLDRDELEQKLCYYLARYHYAPMDEDELMDEYLEHFPA